MGRGIALEDQTIGVAQPMASLPLSTSAPPTKWSTLESKHVSLIRRATVQNALMQQVREFKAKNPFASQKVIAGQIKLERSVEILYTADFIAEKFHCSKCTVSRYLSLSAEVAEGDVTPAAKTMETFAPETPEADGVSRAESLCLTPQKHMALSHKQKISQEQASKAFEVLLKFCLELPPGAIDVGEGIMLGQLMERLRTRKRSD